MPTTRGSGSLVGRVLLALVLMLGFYVVALGVVFGLVWIPYAMWHHGHLNGKIAFFCLAGAFLIMKAIAPRPDRFEPPGPRLADGRHPRLFEMVRSLARATDQAMPAEVYLVPEVNAWVAQRGGLMGFGSRPVMGLGLPLLQTLRVSQLKAVLAHEFGHYHGGDTKLGPWIYKTRAAIGRTLQELAGHSTMLQAPFKGYGALFLRVTHAVSRRQELQADALAARVAGSLPLIEGLKATHGAALAFTAYWSSEVAPVLDSGFLPPLAEGFLRFSQARAVADAVSRGVTEALNSGTSDRYDTHPPLRERVAALARLPSGPPPAEDPPALTLLTEIAELERGLLVSMANEAEVGALKPLDWERVGREVYVPQWRGLAAKHSSALAGWTLGSLPQRVSSLDQVGRALARSAEALAPEEFERVAISVLGAALASALDARGWELDAVPGSAVALHRGAHRIEPFNDIRSLVRAEIAPDAWRERCRAAGIEGLVLTAETLSGTSKGVREQTEP